jgi:hypothetical protein
MPDTPTPAQVVSEKALEAALREYPQGMHVSHEDCMRAAVEAVIDAIRAEGEAVAWPIETDDQVEALARECEWDNRKYMTPADYAIWCERMRKFARLAATPPAPAQVEAASLPAPGGVEEGAAAGIHAMLERFDQHCLAIADRKPSAKRDDLLSELTTIRNSMCRAALATDASPSGESASEADIARWKRDSQLLSAIENECWDVRFTDSPNGDAGDASINIEIVGHFMAEPRERIVGENYSGNLRAALEQAMTADAYPPARPIYDELATSPTKERRHDD